MRTITIEKKVYTTKDFDEYPKVKDNVLEKHWDINLDNWIDSWEYICDYDAKQIGLEISDFDLDRHDIGGQLLDGMMYTIHLIEQLHGKSCDTHKLAQEYSNKYDELFEKYKDSDNPKQVREENEYEFDNELDDLENEFAKELLNEYLSILRQEYEYFTSEESILQTLESNEYEFDENGNIV